MKAIKIIIGGSAALSFLFWLALLGLFIWVCASAQAAPVHRHCKTGTHRVVKHKKHHRRVVRCVKNKVGAPVVEPKVKLHAKLDPSFTRDPLNPFKVTYAYSASASSETASASAAQVSDVPAQLPSGVLSLYSDGSLECAINVGSGIESGECAVRYQELGTHRVTTIYTSGEQSATATEVEQIEPLQTSTALSVTYSDANGGPERTGTSSWLLGTITVTASTSPFGPALLSGLAGLPSELNGSTQIPVTASVDLSGSLGSEPTCEEIKTALAEHGHDWPLEYVSPVSGFTVRASTKSPAPGYMQSEASQSPQYSPTLPC